MVIKDKWKVFAINQLTCATNCTDLDCVALFDKLVDSNVTCLGEPGVEIWEPFFYWEFRDFCDYLLSLATTAQETESSGVSTIKGKWKKYVIEQFVSSYNHPISKIELFDKLVDGDAKFVAELYQVRFFSLYKDQNPVKMAKMMLFNAMMIQQIDNSDEGAGND